MVFQPGTHFTAESTEAMRIECLAHGHSILTQAGFEPSTSVSIDRYLSNMTNMLSMYKYIKVCICICMYIYVYIYILIKVRFLAARKKLKVTDVATSTTSLLQGCGCCDNWWWCCLPVEFLLPELIRNGEKQRRVFMEQSQECESVILVPPLQFNEGFFCSNPCSFFHTTFKAVFLSVQDGCIIDINLMSTRNYAFEDC